MITRIRIKRFKRFEDVDIEFGKSVVLVGPNNSGKTTALQALSLWEIGLKRWLEKRGGKESPAYRPGVTINRNDLISIPIPSADLLWKDLHVRESERIDGKQQTRNVRVEILVDGITNGSPWQCGLEFDYANEESFYCRPLRLNGSPEDRMPVPSEMGEIRLAFLPPMSGLAAIEPKAEPGRISVLIGEGQTAQVLRNLCQLVYDKSEVRSEWNEVAGHIHELFGVILNPPRFIKERGEIRMSYKEPSGIELDLSCAGRGLQQTLLLLAHLYGNPGTILLLDEPDAHLEVLRQRQTYDLISAVASNQNSQVIVASHSEVILNQAADRDIVIAFVGPPHRIDDRGSQVSKALKEIGFEQYYQAEQTGWVLYMEGSTDLTILQTFARRLGHPADAVFNNRPFFRPVGNQPRKARDHFFGVREAKQDLVGIAIFDRLEDDLKTGTPLVEIAWRKKEIENYLCMEEVLLAYARYDQPDDLFGSAETARREAVMRETITEIASALRTLGRPDPWSADIKATDDFLDRLFERYFERLGLPNLLRKTDYHVLAGLVPVERIDREIREKLDAIVEVSTRARPRLA